MNALKDLAGKKSLLSNVNSVATYEATARVRVTFKASTFWSVNAVNLCFHLEKEGSFSPSLTPD